MSSEDGSPAPSTCAACGKEGDGLKKCVACKMVRYCNRECQAAHRSAHKKDCKRRAAELHDEALFREPPPNAECPICFLPLPHNCKYYVHKACCGKVLCIGCISGVDRRAVSERNLGLRACPFCREPGVMGVDEEKLKKRMECGDGYAFNVAGNFYESGTGGWPVDLTKACKMYVRAGELGCPIAYYNVGQAYRLGRGVGVDMKKAWHYYELGAMQGDVWARRNLGCMEADSGRMDRATKHFVIAAKAGFKESLGDIKKLFEGGEITREEYGNALRGYQHSNAEMTSDMRDRAAGMREAAYAMGLDRLSNEETSRFVTQAISNRSFR